MTDPFPVERPERRHLASRFGIGDHLVGVALDLSEIPIVLATHKIPRTGDGVVDERFHRVTHHIETPEGAVHEIVIQGDPYLGLPYGRADTLTLIGVFDLIARNGYYDGRFPDPTASAIARAACLDPQSGLAQVRSALERFANVRIQSRVIRKARQLALDVLSGSAYPIKPDARVMVTTDDRDHGIWILRYSSSTQIVEVDPAEHSTREWARDASGRPIQIQERITRLEVNPELVDQSIAGWVAWIDRELIAGLSSELATRLYMVLAGRAAKDSSPDPLWTYALGQLRSSCGISPTRRAAAARDSLTKAGEELRDAGVLDLCAWKADQRDGYRFAFRPGSALRVANLLRGVGVLDRPDTRIMIALMARYRIDPEVSRPLIAAKPEIVFRNIARAIYLEENNPGEIRKSWAGYILNGIKHDRTWEEDRAFMRWLENGCRMPASTSPAPSPSAPQAPEATFPKCPAPARSTRAVDLWMRVLARATETTPGKMLRPMLEHLAPDDVVGDVLRLYSSLEFPMDWVRAKGTPLIERLLSEETDGAVRTFIIRLWTSEKSPAETTDSRASTAREPLPFLEA